MGAGITRWTTEHIQVIINFSQKVASSKQLYNGLFTGGVAITTATVNIGIYRPHVFYVSSGPNQSYYP